MRRINPSWIAVVLAGTALFVALGGESWATSLITTNQIKDGAITSSKIANHAVTNSKLANGSVGTRKLGNGAVTASKVAPNTFLPVDGVAADSGELGGRTANDFVQGNGRMTQNRIDVPVGSSAFLLEVGIGTFNASCLAGAKPQTSFTAEVAPLNEFNWSTTYPNSADIHDLNGLTVGTSAIVSDSSGLPQATTWQIAESSGAAPKVTTAWTTAQEILGTDCVFTAQALTTGQ
jgi:hypothetical protein